MRSKRSRCAIASVAATAGLLVLSASGPSSGALGRGSVIRLDLTASAHPRVPIIPDVDLVFHVDELDGDSAHAATTATTSADCRGCSGAAIGVQVLYLDRAPSGELDNSAIAWTSACVACHAVAVSVQVVRVSGANTLIPTNRALAVTAKCTRCRASSAAYQLVVAGTGQSRLSASDLRALETWAAERGRQLLREPTNTAPASRRSRAVGARSLGRLADRINVQLGTATVAVRTRVVTG
jgi:hypothetical protein